MAVIINLSILYSAIMAIIALLNYRKNPKAHLCFMALMLCFFAFLIELALIERPSSDFSDKLLVTWLCFSSPATITIPVWFYLYFRASLRTEDTFTMQDGLHFILPVSFALMMLPYGMLPTEEKQAMWQAWSNNEAVSWAFQVKPTREVRMGLVALLGALYTQQCWHELHHQRNRKKNDLLSEFSRLRWTTLLMATGFAFILIFFVIRLSFKNTWLIATVVVAMVFLLGLLYRRLPHLGQRWWLHLKPSNKRITSSEEKTRDLSKIDYEQAKARNKKYRSSVTVEVARSTMEKIHHLMSSGLYRDSSLTLGKLADKLNISQHHLSQIINEQTQGNYFYLLNYYRIEQAKQLLLHTDMSVTEVSYDVGFNSKSSFYTEFKNQTKCTPSQFKAASRHDKRH